MCILRTENAALNMPGAGCSQDTCLNAAAPDSVTQDSPLRSSINAAALRYGRARPCHPRALCGTRWRMMPVRPGANGEGEPGHDAGLCRPDRRMIYNSFSYRKLLEWPRAATLICQVCMNYKRSGAGRVADADWPKNCPLNTFLRGAGFVRILPQISRDAHG